MATPPPVRSLATPAFWAAGWTCVAVGMIGVAVPMLPTTPFLLLAAWCFDRSSPRLHAWLLRTRVLGALLRDWRERGAIHPRAKLACTLLLVAAGIAAFARGTTPVWALGGMLVVSIGALAFVWTRPSR